MLPLWSKYVALGIQGRIVVVTRRSRNTCHRMIQAVLFKIVGEDGKWNQLRLHLQRIIQETRPKANRTQQPNSATHVCKCAPPPSMWSTSKVKLCDLCVFRRIWGAQATQPCPVRALSCCMSGSSSSFFAKSGWNSIWVVVTLNDATCTPPVGQIVATDVYADRF